MSTFTTFFDKADKRFDQIAKTVKKDRDELRKEENLERLAVNLYGSFEKGLKKDLSENNVEGSSQVALVAIAKKAWEDQEMGRQAKEIVESPELGKINDFVTHIENLPRLKECIESADPKANWQVMLAGILGGTSGVNDFFGPVLSALGLDFLTSKDEKEKEKKDESAKASEATSSNDEDEENQSTESAEKTEEVNECKETVRLTPKSTVFFGDSNTWKMTTVAKGCIDVEGEVLEKAIGGEHSKWGAEEAERLADQNPSPLKKYENAVVLLGSNDLLMYTPTEVTDFLTRTYKALKRGGVKHVYAATIPPVKGTKGYGARAIKNQKTINEWIRKTPEEGLAYRVIDLAAKEKDGGMADNNDPDKLCSAAHSGDGLHFDKNLLASRYQEALELGTGAAAQQTNVA